MSILEVRQARREEVQKDIVRVPKDERKNKIGQAIEAGTICKILSPSTAKSTFAVLRGIEETGEEDVIRMDEYLRENLDVEFGKKYEFIFETKWWYRFVWPWKATDPGYKISSQIAFISFGLGIISLILGLIAIC
ncbi:hypothetical protein A3D71_04610 [Candidatus Kaiserbacteria bacterium RIFCSPHIGHO2_02_FULL_55_20]|uniref:Uncharacterized protein n=1 Tax=Candidatus Kaiserbacteria bacterium RIFCSPHIGHO2_02_FULL_55_20 TaxID=1798497 RepID=A0A1F6DVC1_9BACT|nr:MAG: hypothetical protein A3D71_04610 [Candidatus Kaiserbacteria bacterium RIFCSPHIGHO2_02_FULL_55_20]